MGHEHEKDKTLLLELMGTMVSPHVCRTKQFDKTQKYAILAVVG